MKHTYYKTESKHGLVTTSMSECCEADVRCEALEVRERVERPDLCELERAEGGSQVGE